jgi:hypothetical protein
MGKSSSRKVTEPFFLAQIDICSESNTVGAFLSNNFSFLLLLPSAGKKLPATGNAVGKR